MKYLLPLLFAAGFAAPAFAAEAPADKIDELIAQNKTLIAQNRQLLELRDRPLTKEEAFAQCMQAARGEKSAMATESISSSCRQLLK